MSKLKGVIFDMDGLMFDTESVYSRINVEVAKNYPMTGYDEEYYLSEIGLGESTVYQKYLKDFPDLTSETIDEFVKESRTKTWEEFQKNGAPLKKGIKELLEFLKEENIPCVVSSSNWRVVIDLLLEKSGLGEYFIGSISGDDVAHAKPHPEIVEKAVELLDVSPGDSLMLEDSLNGVRASHTAGVPVIMVPDLVVPDDEIKEKSIAIEPDLLAVIDWIKKN